MGFLSDIERDVMVHRLTEAVEMLVVVQALRLPKGLTLGDPGLKERLDAILRRVATNAGYGDRLKPEEKTDE